MKHTTILFIHVCLNNRDRCQFLSYLAHELVVGVAKNGKLIAKIENHYTYNKFFADFRPIFRIVVLEVLFNKLDWHHI